MNVRRSTAKLNRSFFALLVYMLLPYLAHAAPSAAVELSAQAPLVVDQNDRALAQPTLQTADFLANSTSVSAHPTFSLWRPFDEHPAIPLSHWVTDGLAWVVTNFRPAFQLIRVPIDQTLTSFDSALQMVPQPLMLLLIGILAWRTSGYRLAIGSVLAFIFIGLTGAWSETMATLSMVLTSLFFCLLIGLPLGIACARSDRLQAVVRPVLDAMQTTPAFVYLVPVVMLFGIGNVPGVLVTIIFALAPLVRLTTLGICQVRPDLIEASRSFGASSWQMLFKVQLPLAMPTIMAGVNQALMMSLSMVVIASMIAVGGLGQMVLRGIGRLDLGLAAVGGIGIVLTAIILDRMTQSFGSTKRSSKSL
ncbi:glycine betaine/L-proline ABC transporter permease ProW [Pseudomonas sp. 10-1B]|uniref:glycine betaine/L-proline ABC transporter permease ProW n=1 Tax=Pseudomonas sp. 10-1B TaxID=1546029 RepID=UPI000A50588D|nr:glycine betaine/L-proline ABC transporter permease ProW [Pseudomonas sp. 10-1B]